jgi:hypothetical protein
MLSFFKYTVLKTASLEVWKRGPSLFFVLHSYNITRRDYPLFMKYSTLRQLFLRFSTLQ